VNETKPRAAHPWRARVTLTLFVLGCLYLAEFSRVVLQSKVYGVSGKPCLQLADVSTPEGWRLHQRRAAIFSPLFWFQWRFLGAARPCRQDPGYLVL
jgi:hypothetical protein